LKQMAPFAKGLRRAGRTLGAVRDLDVLHEKMQVYVETLPPERKTELDPLLAAWRIEHERARQELIDYLDSSRYARFKERFGQFLQTAEAGAPPLLTEDGDLIPHRVRHVLPVIVQERLASVRAHGEWVAAPDAPLQRFHRLRIASKELRYALEFFQEVLGPESKALISTMKALQDHLGNLQDAVVACNLLRDFLTWGTWGHEETTDSPWPTSPVVAPGVATYLAVRQTEIQTLVQSFPPVWAQVASLAFQKGVEAALRPLW
jgi:CHAD domain-containing protein